MKYDFDEVIDRRGTGSVRWDNNIRKYGEPDLIPLTTADMDYRTAEPVRQALREAAEFGVFGYTQPRPSYYEAVLAYYARYFKWNVPREWVLYSAGIVGAIAFCIQGMTHPGDGIALLTPVYHPFSHITENNGRTVAACPLVQQGDTAAIDFDALERVLAGENTRMLIFCNPHNPIGRAWTEEELRRVCELCVANHVILVSDEIHSDFVYPGRTFVSAGPVMERAGGAEQLVVCSSASKTYNIAGLQCSNVIIPGETLRAQYRAVLMQQHYMEMNMLGPIASEAAYRSGGEWLAQCLAYLQKNRDDAAAFLRQNVPQIRPVVPEATYMMWLDCRGLGLAEPDLEAFLAHRARVALNMGSTFGPGGEGYVRINFGTTHALLMQALTRIRDAVRTL